MAAFMIVGCELMPPPVPDKPIKTKPVYPGWDDSLSKIICYTDGVTVKYDNRLYKLEIGLYDVTTQSTDYNDSWLAELINVDQQKIEDKMVYNIVYKVGRNTFKYRMHYGLWEHNKRHNKIHNSPRMIELGYKPIKGVLIKNGKISSNKSFCWGINEADRKLQDIK